MELDVTQILAGFDPFDYSRSRFEGGETAGRNTWNNAKRDGLKSEDSPSGYAFWES